MKVGILTFHDSVNYGAVLQAYALQKAVNKFADCEIIDYRCEATSAYKKLNDLKKPKKMKDYIRKILSYKYLNKKVANFSEFLNNYCNISDCIYTKKNIIEACGQYNCFITGSDQVFNKALTDNDLTFYLDFVNKSNYKVAYAASCGSYTINEQELDTVALLKDFDAISCREEELTKKINRMVQHSNETVLDPTFLLTKTEWLNIEKKIDMPKEYILLYLVSPRKEYFSYVKKLSAKTGLPIYCVNYSYRRYLNINNLMNVSPNQFIYLIHNASYVVTNSFHGTALSLIMERNFYTLLDKSREKSNQRMINILKKVNLLERMIPLDEVEFLNEIDYNNIETKLDKIRKGSINFLNKIQEFNYK